MPGLNVLESAAPFNKRSPGGRLEPVATRHEYGGTPFVALSNNDALPPTTTSFNLVEASPMSSSGGTATRMGNANSRVIGLTQSVAVTTKVKSPGEAGVPLLTPSG